MILIPRPELSLPVEHAFADGGVVSRNPSPAGGSWAVVLVAGGKEVFRASGGVTPVSVGLPAVSNNLTETLALLIALECLPDGWAGRAHSDSLNALRCFNDPDKGKPAHLPAWLWDRRCAVLKRLGEPAYVLLGGHPNREELAAGVRKDGKPVSEWNVLCDQMCGEENARLAAGVTNEAA